MSTVNNTTGVINKAALTLTAVTNTKTYDATTGAAAAPTVSGLQGADTVTGLSESYADKNAGTGKTLSVDAGYVVNDGNGGNNYTVSTVNNTMGVINKAALTVIANNDAKFVTKADSPGYAGASYTGFVGGENAGVLGGTLNITRGNAGVGEAAGVYNGVLNASGLTSGNYTISYTAGNYTVVPANQLLVRLNNVSATYGSTPAYSVQTAQYMLPDGTVVDVNSAVTGSQVSVNDGAGGNVDFNVAVTGAAFSTSNNLRVNSYQLDGANVTGSSANFSNNLTVLGARTVDPLGITISPTGVSKTYDATTSMTGLTLNPNGKLTGDILTANGNGSFGSKNAGTNLAYTINNLGLSGADAGNYALTNGGGSYSGNDGVINKAALTLTAVTNTKTYDAMTGAAAAPTVGGLQGTDSVTGLSESYADKNAGSGKTLSVDAGYVVNDGNGGNNYTVSTVNNTTGVINKAALTLTAATNTKTYDATTGAAAAPTVGGLQGADTVTGLTESYADKNAGSGKTLSVDAGYVVNDGNGGNNYTVSTVNNTMGVINKAALTVIANNDAKFVTKADNAGYAGASYTGFVGGENAGVLGGTLNITRGNAGVGEAAGVYNGVLNASGLTSGNYTISYTAGNYTVVPANQLLVRLNNVSATYGSTPAYSVQTAQYMQPDGTVVDVNSAVTGSRVSVNDGAGGNVDFNVAVTGAAYSTSNNLRVNSYQLDGANVTGSSGNFSNNLTVLGARTVDPLGIIFSPAGVSKTYDATTSMTGLTLNLNGKLTGDILTASGNGSFGSKNAGTNLAYTVNNLGLSGADAGNYTLTNGGGSYSGNDGVINKAALTLTAVANTKTYDATTGAAAGPTVSGLQGADTVTGLSESYADKNAGSGKTLSVDAGYVVNDGNGGNNYTVSTFNNTTGVINKAALTLTAVGEAKGYDATTNSAGAPIVSGLLGADTLTGISQSFTDKNAGTGKTLSVNSGYTLNDGNGGNNYAVSNVNNTTGVINKAALTLTAATNTKTYDATTGAAAVPTVGGLQGADTVTGLSESYADKNAGSGKTLSVDAGYVVNDGNGGNNYTVSTVNNTTGVITQRSITVMAPNDVTKTFDGNTSVPSSYVPVISGGVGEGVQSASLSYATPDIGTGKTVNVSNVVMNDGNGGNNYIVTPAANNTGVINPAVGPVIGNGQSVSAEVVPTLLRNIPSGASDIPLEVPISLEGKLQADGFIHLTDILPQIPEITTITSVAETGLAELPAGVSYDAMSGQLQYEKLAAIPLYLTATGLDRNHRLRHIKLRIRFWGD